jgi:hypothetical protein
VGVGPAPGVLAGAGASVGDTDACRAVLAADLARAAPMGVSTGAPALDADPQPQEACRTCTSDGAACFPAAAPKPAGCEPLIGGYTACYSKSRTLRVSPAGD